MSMFGDLVGKAIDKVKSTPNVALAEGLIGVLSNPAFGGVTGLAKQMAAKGFGKIMDSWVGTGANLPITADQVTQVLGSDVMKQLAAKAGIQQEQVAKIVAEVLPVVVDRLSPSGQAPATGDIASKGLDILKGFLK